MKVETLRVSWFFTCTIYILIRNTTLFFIIQWKNHSKTTETSGRKKIVPRNQLRAAKSDVWSSISSNTHHFNPTKTMSYCQYCWWFRNPAPDMVNISLFTGFLTYWLVFSPDFWSINSTSTRNTRFFVGAKRLPASNAPRKLLSLVNQGNHPSWLAMLPTL